MDIRLLPCIVENAYGQRSPSLLRAGASPEQLGEGRLDEQKPILATPGLLVLDHHQLGYPIVVDGVGGGIDDIAAEVADIAVALGVACVECYIFEQIHVAC